ncbi:hypothetical protein tloyanaT_03820 [Thalassotalea loyana]|uniref:Oxidoreductase-like domain-containing protein n=1 Tax=Thalassotalea loyana TaxID=280483 RepID=A0ABQ6HBJ5_9GAMM|nr:oxidoreductase-like domain-containing protein [Thalassotalea loyana]GLX84130.1 hypothetical protein tloyanaT_03820 [Thalassotalea loyana]
MPNSEEIIEKPTQPADDDCCGGGACNPCVWDAYNAKMRAWREQQAKLKGQDNLLSTNLLG